jgi:hypothetical protein
MHINKVGVYTKVEGFMSSYEDYIVKIIAYTELLLQEIEQEVDELNFDVTSLHNKLVIALFLSIYEIANSIPILLRSKAHITVPSLIRNMLEAYVDLKNIAKDVNYKSVMISSYLKELKRFLQNNEENLEPVPSLLPDVSELLNTYKLNIKTTFASRFKEAGLQKIYVSIYNKLCNETHNNVNCLLERHFDWENKKDEIVIFKERRIHTICYWIQVCNSILQSAFKELLKFQNVKQSLAYQKIKILNEKYNEEFNKFLK